jgi:hypothetical protein
MCSLAVVAFVLVWLESESDFSLLVPSKMKGRSFEEWSGVERCKSKREVAVAREDEKARLNFQKIPLQKSVLF